MDYSENRKMLAGDEVFAEALKEATWMAEDKEMGY